jgi:hypothetical protein
MLAINEDRILSLIKYFVAKPESILKELVQNSRRAKAKNVNITLKDDKLIYTDDGNGISSYKSLLVLGETGWDNEIVENETPAGFGFYSLISHAESINLNYGDLIINCPRFLNDAQYRSTILNAVEGLPVREGFHFEAVLLPGTGFDLDSDNLCYFEDMNIYVNGDKKNIFSAEFIAERIENSFIHTQYEGNHLFISKDVYIYGLHNKDMTELKQLIIYKGEPICVSGGSITYPNNDIIYIIKQGNPLNIQLPFRDDIKRDEKYDKFIEFCRDALGSYVQKLVENKDRFHLKERTVGSDYDAEIIRKAILEDKCEGLVLTYTKEQFYNIYADKFLVLTKPEKVEKVEEVLGSKIALLKRGNDFEIASSSIRIGIPCKRWPECSKDKMYTEVIKYLEGIDIININKVMFDIPVVSYNRLKDNEYMIGVTPESVSSWFPVIILIKNKDNIVNLWSEIKHSEILYGHILVSGCVEEDINLKAQVYDIIDDIDKSIHQKYKGTEFIISRIWDVIDKYGYSERINKEKLKLFIEQEIGGRNGERRRKKTT